MQVLNLIIAFLVSLILVPLNRKLSIKLGVVSYPRERDAHKEPTPRMGGLSVAISFILSVITFMFFTQEINVKKCVFIILGAIVLAVVGVVDDIYQIKPYQKMAGQIIAIALAIFGGVNVRFLVWDKPGIIAYYLVKALNIFGTFFWTLGMINAINLIDGLDGLSSGISVIAAISFMVIAVTNGNTLAMLLAVSIAGATLGFLAYNFHPAKIFIGDTGSMLLGYTLALVALETGFEYLNVVCFAAPISILAVPIFDTAYAIIRRIVNRIPITEADKNHTHHKLMRKGFKYRTVVIILYIFSIAFGFTGVCISRTQSVKFIILSIILILLLICIIYEKKDKKSINEEKKKNGNK